MRYVNWSRPGRLAVETGVIFRVPSQQPQLGLLQPHFFAVILSTPTHVDFEFAALGKIRIVVELRDLG
jgi:hypothetical protein